MSRRVWAMIDADFHQDDAVAAIAEEHGPRALTYWAVFICESKKVHRGKADGWAGPFTLTQFAALCYDDKARRNSIKKLVDSFVEAGLLELSYVHGSDTLGRWKSRPSNFLALQSKGNNAVDVAESRQRLQGNKENSQDSVSGMSDARQVSVSGSHGRAEIDVDVYVDVEQSSKLDKSHADPESWLNSEATYTPTPTDPMMEFIHQISSILEEAYKPESVQQVAEAIYRLSVKRGPHVTVYPVEQWMRAARHMVDAIKSGKMQEPGKFVGWMRATVPTAIEKPLVRDGVGVPAEDPDVVRVREIAARYSSEGAA